MKFISHLETPTSFEGYYNKIRKAENRLLSLNQIRNLPQTDKEFRHHQEWNLRIKSTERIMTYLARKRDFTLLDLGCGNGWFLYKLRNMGKALTGVDINLLELNQAQKVLKDIPELTLHYGDIFEINFQKQFDFIVLNGCVQYFPYLKTLLNCLLPLLSKGGELHILDSPFYKNTMDAQNARKRSQDYYAEAGVKDMVDYYHHHTFLDLKDHQFEIMYNPYSIKRRFMNFIMADSPHYWIRVKE